MAYYKHIAPLALKSMISDDFKPRSGGMIVKMTLCNIDILSITISIIMPNKLGQRKINT